MAKSKKELEEIRSRVEELSAVLQELSEEELSEVLGGSVMPQLVSRPGESLAHITKILGESCAD